MNNVPTAGCWLKDCPPHHTAMLWRLTLSKSGSATVALGLSWLWSLGCVTAFSRSWLKNSAFRITWNRATTPATGRSLATPRRYNAASASHGGLCLTWAIEVVIFVPPEPPTTIFTWLFLSKRMVGHMDDIGVFPFESNCKFSSVCFIDAYPRKYLLWCHWTIFSWSMSKHPHLINLLWTIIF